MDVLWISVGLCDNPGYLQALYENLLVELPMADFFLSKILGQANASLDVHHMASLDPVLHKNLLYLRHYEGDVTDLGLDFTIVSSELGETKVTSKKTSTKRIRFKTDWETLFEYITKSYSSVLKKRRLLLSERITTTKNMTGVSMTIFTDFYFCSVGHYIFQTVLIDCTNFGLCRSKS